MLQQNTNTFFILIHIMFSMFISIIEFKFLVVSKILLGFSKHGLVSLSFSQYNVYSNLEKFFYILTQFMRARYL